MEMTLSGRGVDAEEALQMGLVSRIVETPQDLLPECLVYARLLSSFPQICMRSGFWGGVLFCLFVCLFVCLLLFELLLFLLL